jgi:DHA2 family multidrug resistance protein
MSFILGFGLYGSTLIIPIYTQSILRWTATDAGLLLIPGSITTAIMMPFVGRMIQKGVPQSYMVGVGFLSFFIFTFMMHNVMTPDTGVEHMFWPLILRGVGLGLLFVPITTLSLSTLKGKNIGEGAAFTGMMRQLGGSLVSLLSLLLLLDLHKTPVDLIANLDGSSFEIQQRLMQLQRFYGKGFTVNESLKKAYQVFLI